MTAQDLGAWVGRQEERDDLATPPQVRALRALLDYPAGAPVPSALPLLAHWLFFQDPAPQSALDRDGHPHRGGFLPPVALPRRMWASGEVRFLAPIAMGCSMQRRSTICAVTPKLGKSGAMMFVTVDHEILVHDAPAILETQHIVYRETGGAMPVPPIVPPPLVAPLGDWAVEIIPDPTLLFRYSAVTFNTHRIHYDRPYAMGEEGYAGLIVHGPLLAALLLDQFLRHHPGACVTRFAFRALQPVIEGRPILLCGAMTGEGADLAVVSQDGVAMSAQVELG